jgi:hypothetical protein
MAVPFTQLVATTFDDVSTERNKAADQWSDSSTLMHLERIGGLKRVPGGATLQIPLDYQQNPALDFLATDTTATSTTKTSVITAASYSYVPYVVPVNYTLFDEALNSEKSQKIDLVSAIVDNMITSHDQGIEAALFATTGGTDGMNTFVDIFTEDGTGTVGTIVAGTETWWKNKFKDWGTDTGATLIADYNTLYYDCSRGSSGRQPNVVVANATLYGSFVSALQANQRWVGNTATAKAGFDNIKLINADYIYTSVITTAQDSAWMWNTNDTKIYVVRGAWRQRRPAIESLNSIMVNIKTFSVLQLATSNRSRGGVLFT